MAAQQADLQVIILAAGQGKRMHSELPKVLHRFCGWSLLERTLRAALGLKPKKIVCVIGFGAELVTQELQELRAKLDFSTCELVSVVQAEQRGTGHAVQQALPQLLPHIPLTLIVPGDAPLLTSSTLQAFVAGALTSDLALLSFFPPDPNGFGRVIRGQGESVFKVVEEKDCTTEEHLVPERNSSIYCLKTSQLPALLAALCDKNAQGELYFTDTVQEAVRLKLKVIAVPAADYREVAGANNRLELAELEQIRRAQINAALMKKGVTFEDPQATYIDEAVEIGADSFIGAQTRLRGNTRLGQKVCIDGQSEIIDSQLGDQVHVKLCCSIESSVIAANCDLGPFAHLRPGTKLHERVKVGNFVEVKKSELLPGVKASHLTYLGDATVGKDVNIGAGTITCNYDGVNKNRTVIEEGSFIGSDTSLVAPVRVGAGAIVGAGSVITKDVPPGALAIERSKQINKEGWAIRKRSEQLAKKNKVVD